VLPGVWRACGNFIQPHIRTVLIAGVRRGREGSGSTEERVLYQIRRPLGLVFVIYFLVAGRIVAALYLAEL
jgi:hypothetical protein